MISSITAATAHPPPSTKAPKTPGSPLKGAPSLADLSLRAWAHKEFYEPPKRFWASAIDAALGDYPHLAQRAQKLLTPLAMMGALTPQSICRNPNVALGILGQVRRLAPREYERARIDREDVHFQMAKKFIDMQKMLNGSFEADGAAQPLKDVMSDRTRLLTLSKIEAELEAWTTDVLNQLAGYGDRGTSSAHLYGRHGKTDRFRHFKTTREEMRRKLNRLHHLLRTDPKKFRVLNDFP